MSRTPALLGVDQLPTRGQHIEVHLHSWVSRCPCGGSAWRSTAPDHPTRSCSYQPDGRNDCGRLVRWERADDRIETGRVMRTKVGPTGDVQLAWTPASRRVADQRPVVAWTEQAVSGWRAL